MRLFWFLAALWLPTLAAAQSPSAKEQMATFINLHGHLCASVERITRLQHEGAYEVECIQYRGGQTRVSYVVDLKRNQVARQ